MMQYRTGQTTARLLCRLSLLILDHPHLLVYFEVCIFISFSAGANLEIKISVLIPIFLTYIPPPRCMCDYEENDGGFGWEEE